MKIASARVIVTCPGRNFVTLKIETDEGVTGIGDATLNGRELAVASYLDDHVIPLPDRPRRRSGSRTSGSTSIAGAYWRRGPVTMTRDRRGRHGAVGHQGARSAGHAALPAARRQEPRRRAWSMATPTARDHRRDGRRGRRAISSMGYKAIRAQSGVPGPRQGLRRRPRRHATTSRPTRALPTETVWSTPPSTSTSRRSCSRRCATTYGFGPSPAARRASPPDADRGGAARQGARAATACSGWRTRRRPRTRRRSA